MNDSGVDIKSAESTLLVPDSYGKVSISLDEMMPDVSLLIFCLFLFFFLSFSLSSSSHSQGIIETLDHDTIKKMTKLKNFV